MVVFPIARAVAREFLRSLADAAVVATKGRAAAADRQTKRLIKLYEPFVEPELLATDSKFVQLKADVADMAAKIGRAPPEILVTTLPFVAMMAPSEKTLLVAKEELERSTSKELRAIAGHELSHTSRGDHLHFDRPPNHAQELAADRLGVELSGEPEAMVSWLERRAKEDPISAQGTRVYPPISKRIEGILRAGKSSPASASSPESPPTTPSR